MFPLRNPHHPVFCHRPPHIVVTFSLRHSPSWILSAMMSGSQSSHCSLSAHSSFFFFLNSITLFFFPFHWRLITLQYCSGLCHTFTWISHGCTCVPHPEPPAHLPPQPIPQGHPSAPALSTLSHASNLDWWSVSHMLIYMFQCYSLKSSHPCLLWQSQTVFSLYLCFFCCLAHSSSVNIY